MNFIYTYVPKEDDKKLDSEFYLIDVILMILSVSKVKKFKSESDRLIFYSTKEFYSYIEPLNLFDEFVEIKDENVYIKNQDYKYCHRNNIYKIYVTTLQTEPFINLDHDFIIYSKELFDKIKEENLVFSFKEFLTEPDYVPTYLPTLDRVIEEVGGHHDVLQNLDKDYSINVSIFGGKKSNLMVDAYKKIWDFYIENYVGLNKISLMVMFLDQFLLKTQIYRTEVKPYYCWDDMVSGDCIHFTGFRYEINNRKRIVNELIEENLLAYKYILTEFGFFPDYMIKITDN
jgi:hypothetical protein